MTCKLNKEKFIDKIRLLSKNVSYFYLSVIGWQDGDYFLELSKEDGGVNYEDLKIFTSFPLGIKVSTNDFLELIGTYKKKPFLSSLNGNYNFHYDIHIWLKNRYIVYNFFHEEIHIEKMSFFQRVFKSAKIIKWGNVRSSSRPKQNE